MSTPAEQIKERLGIVDVVSSYLKLEKAGGSFKAKCPFHNEKTPSFFVSPARGTYYCFGCGQHGDIFTFVQEFEGLDFVGALRVLAGRAGVVLQRLDPKQRSEYARLYLLLEFATRFYEAQLEANTEAKEYLKGRGLSDETKKTWRLGFAPEGWRGLHDTLVKEGFTPDEMKRVGLVKTALPKEYSTDSAQTDSAQVARVYDTFRGRIMFPIVDSASRVIAFSGRILPRLDDGTTGKYINSPETVLFKKSDVLHGFHLAKLAVRQKDAAILVEGQMDLLMAHQAGFANTVASSGTALTEQQLKRLQRLSENLLIAFDSDNAGLKAAERAIRLALSLGMNVKVIALKEKDPADLIAKEPAAWERAVNDAQHIIEFLLGSVLASVTHGRERALAIEKTLLPLLRLLPSSVEQAHFVKVIAEKSGLREDALWESFKKLPTLAKSAPAAQQPQPKRESTSARRLFSVLFLAEARGDEDLKQRLSSELQRVFGEEYGAKRAHYATLQDALLAEAESAYGEGIPVAQEEQELLRHVEEERGTEQLTALMDELVRAEREGKKEEAKTLLQKYKAVSGRLAELKAKRYQN